MEGIKRSLLFALFLIMCTLVQAQRLTVQGKVVSKTDGESIIGATVIETNQTSNGTITDIDGNFTLSVPQGAELSISYIGFKTVNVKAQATLNIVLEEESELLQEVVVTGYTTQRKADLTGAISVVSIDEMPSKTKQPNQALQGRVPGMNITADGNPSGNATVRIRGVGTLNNNDPLYIIDGVPTKSGMHELNGNDIESIQVLKDAASASIYGSRAAGGVVLITTKKGAEGKVKVEYSGSATLKTVGLMASAMNIDQWADGVMTALTNDKKTSDVWYTYAELAKKYKGSYLDMRLQS